MRSGSKPIDKKIRPLLYLITEQMNSAVKNYKTTITAKERAFSAELAKYENSWVAISRTKSGDKIVGSGRTVIDAKNDAESRGHKNVVYQKVPSSDKVFIA